MIRFLDLVRSTLFSTTLRTPMAEIIPYSMKLTPPMIEDGMVLMSADTFGMKLTIIAKTAAIRMTLGSCTRSQFQNAGVLAVRRVGRSADETCHCGCKTIAEQGSVQARIRKEVLSYGCRDRRHIADMLQSWSRSRSVP